MPSPKTQNPKTQTPKAQNSTAKTKTKTKTKSEEAAAASHPEWDRKRGAPKSQDAERVVEKATDRYSASGQSEDTRKAQARRP